MPSTDPFRDVLDVRGRTCMVTGASDGIGLAAAISLARAGAELVLVVRNAERGRAAIARIHEQYPFAHVDMELADLSNQAAIRALGERYVKSGRPLHVLLNNAGIWSTTRQLSVDGIEMTFATNMLGYFLLTQVLEPVLRKSAPARIVNVTSGLARSLDFNDINFDRRPYGTLKGGVESYAQSKQANRMWTWNLARRLEGTGVTVNAMNPGDTRTNAFKKGGGVIGWIVQYGNMVMAKSAADGADTAVWLAASPSMEGVTGKYFEKRREVPCQYHDPVREEELWKLCERLTAPREAARPIAAAG